MTTDRDAPCSDHWHCCPVLAAHTCDHPNQLQSCPTCGEDPAGVDTDAETLAMACLGCNHDVHGLTCRYPGCRCMMRHVCALDSHRALVEELANLRQACATKQECIDAHKDERQHWIEKVAAAERRVRELEEALQFVRGEIAHYREHSTSSYALGVAAKRIEAVLASREEAISSGPHRHTMECFNECPPAPSLLACQCNQAPCVCMGFEPITLTAEQFAFVMDLIERPPAPTEALKALFRKEPK